MHNLKHDPFPFLFSIETLMERSLHETSLSSSHLMLQKDKFKTHSILSNLQSMVRHGEAIALLHHETEMVCNSHINAEIKQF